MNYLKYSHVKQMLLHIYIISNGKIADNNEFSMDGTSETYQGKVNNGFNVKEPINHLNSFMKL